MPNRIAITNEKGEARFEGIPAGVHSFSVEAEGFEPVRGNIEVGRENTKTTVVLKPMTKGFITVDNIRLRGLIRASTVVLDIGSYVKESERLIELSPSKLKKFAAKQFHKTTDLAHGRIEEIRRLESSTDVSIGPKGVTYSKKEQKRGLP